MRRPIAERHLPKYLHSPDDVAHVLERVAFMRRFFDDVVDENPATRRHLPELHGAYMDMLNEEIAPYALDLALSLIALQERLGKHRASFLSWNTGRVRGNKRGRR